jgi:hypothetical protein
MMQAQAIPAARPVEARHRIKALAEIPVPVEAREWALRWARGYVLTPQLGDTFFKLGRALQLRAEEIAARGV